MDDNSIITLDVASTDTSSGLALSIWLDDQCVFQTQHVREPIRYNQVVNDDPGKHELKIVMSGKTQNDTFIDDHGNIVKDALLNIAFSVDNINFDEVFQKNAVYTHNFNGAQNEIVDTFHGLMGCNGVLSLKFTTPLFIWVLG
jgi:hypothetical protein